MNKYECIKKIESDIEDIKHTQKLIIKELRKNGNCEICIECEGRGRFSCGDYFEACSTCKGRGFIRQA